MFHYDEAFPLKSIQDNIGNAFLWRQEIFWVTTLKRLNQFLTLSPLSYTSMEIQSVASCVWCWGGSNPIIAGKVRTSISKHIVRSRSPCIDRLGAASHPDYGTMFSVFTEGVDGKWTRLILGLFGDRCFLWIVFRAYGTVVIVKIVIILILSFCLFTHRVHINFLNFAFNSIKSNVKTCNKRTHILFINKYKASSPFNYNDFRFVTL